MLIEQIYINNDLCWSIALALLHTQNHVIFKKRDKKLVFEFKDYISLKRNF